MKCSGVDVAWEILGIVSVGLIMLALISVMFVAIYMMIKA